MASKQKQERKMARKLKKSAAKIEKLGATREDKWGGFSMLVATARGIVPAGPGFEKGPRYAVRSLACPACLLWKQAVEEFLPTRLAELTDPKAATRPADTEPGVKNHLMKCKPCAREWDGLVGTVSTLNMLQKPDDCDRMALELRPDTVIGRATSDETEAFGAVWADLAARSKATGADPLVMNVPGVGEAVTMPGFARLLYEMPIEEMSNRDIHPLVNLLKQRVNDAMATARALGKDPDLQETINEVVDVQAMNGDIDRACKGESIDLAKNMLRRLQQGVN